MDFSALATDLDGTFWGKDMSLHAETVATVEALDAAALPLIVATGRRARSTLVGLAPHGLSDRPAILMNGGLVRDRLDRESFHRSSIPTADALAVREAFNRGGLEPLVYVDDPELDLLAAPNAAAGASFLGTAPGVRPVDDIVTGIRSSFVTGFGAFGYPLDQLREIQQDVERLEGASAIISPSHLEGDFGIMVQSRHADKAYGLDVYCERHGLDRNAIVAVGDGFNDLAMLQSAAIAIVPSNAPDEVQALADHIVAPNEDGGWEEVRSILGL